MPFQTALLHKFSQKGAALLRKIGKACLWFALLTPLSVTTGILTAFFFLSLEKMTYIRFDHPTIVLALPAAGVLMAGSYLLVNHLMAYKLIDEQDHDISDPSPSAYARFCRKLAPLIRIPMSFCVALGSNLFGASVGREGVALHMAGNLSLLAGYVFKMKEESRHVLVLAGIAAGFGSIFGAPVAGAVFVLETIGLGVSLGYGALLACGYGAITASLSCTVCENLLSLKSLGSQIGPLPYFSEKFWQFTAPDPLLLAKVGLASIFFGLMGYCYTNGVTLGQKLADKICKPHWLHPAIGGCITLGLFALCGTDAYLGLGTVSHHPDQASTINFFKEGFSNNSAFLWKFLFTLTALSTGFRGGKVTPIFFIGAALGSTLAPLLGAPAQLLAATGMMAMFAAANGTPFTCIIMGAEIFGSSNFVYDALACMIAYAVAGQPPDIPPKEKVKQFLGVKQPY